MVTAFPDPTSPQLKQLFVSPPSIKALKKEANMAINSVSSSSSTPPPPVNDTQPSTSTENVTQQQNVQPQEQAHGHHGHHRHGGHHKGGAGNDQDQLEAQAIQQQWQDMVAGKNA